METLLNTNLKQKEELENKENVLMEHSLCSDYRPCSMQHVLHCLAVGVIAYCMVYGPLTILSYCHAPSGGSRGGSLGSNKPPFLPKLTL